MVAFYQLLMDKKRQQVEIIVNMICVECVFRPSFDCVIGRASTL